MAKAITHRSHKRNLTALAALTLGLTIGTPFTASVQAQQLIVNGGFETGNFTGWTVVDAPGSAVPGAFMIGNNTPDPNLMPSTPSTPLEHFPSAGAAGGNYYAVTDSSGPGAHALLQNFTLAPDAKSVLFSFDMFINDWNGAGALNADDVLNPNPLDGNGNLIPTQFVSVDLLSGNAADLTDDVGLIDNLYLGEDGFSATALPNGYEHFQYDLTNFVQAGGTYRIRFAEVDNQFTINAGIDNVSLVASAVPEPGSVALGATLCSGLLILASRRLRKRHREAERRLIAHLAGE
jgi:hypothetical protein